MVVNVAVGGGKGKRREKVSRGRDHMKEGMCVKESVCIVLSQRLAIE
jgi:hypothetical protein